VPQPAPERGIDGAVSPMALCAASIVAPQRGAGAPDRPPHAHGNRLRADPKHPCDNNYTGQFGFVQRTAPIL